MNKIDFRKRDLLFIDLETTGLDIAIHEITEIGCLLVDGKTFEIKDRYHIRVKPEHIETASKYALKIGGYSKEKWEDAVNIKKALKQLVKFSKGAMFAGWKIDFDWWFLDTALNKNKIRHDIDYHLFDVIPLAYFYFRKKRKPNSLSLRSVAKRLDIKVDDQHSAMEDIEATYKVFIKLLKKLDLY